MQYVVSDIHGCCKEFKNLLKLINFSAKDLLYVLGDVVDRGPDPVGLLQFMSMYDNIIPIMGNHEYMMLKVLPTLLTDLQDLDIEMRAFQQFRIAYELWFNDGGQITANAFRKLPEEDRNFLLDYVGDFSTYEQVTVGGQKYLLIHSLPRDFYPGRRLDYSLEEILFSRPDFFARWDGDTTYIIGHTPTFYISAKYNGKIFRNGHLIDIDCGCAAGRRLGAFCLDTGHTFYVPAADPDPEQ